MKNNESLLKQNPFEITFETKCYERDWEYLLKTKHLDRMICNCNTTFSFRQLIINNVKQPELVKRYAQQKVDKGIIDAFYFVDDYIDEALPLFGLQRDSFGIGYYYSCSELVGLYLSKTKYHLHFSSDAFMLKNHRSKWIIEACTILEKDSRFVTANPTWNHHFDDAKKESIGEKAGNFYMGYGFSDQCYLVRTADFKAKIYNYSHPISERYPKYGGELFEKRIDSFMRSKGLLRLTSTHEAYIHKNFSKKNFFKPITLILLKLKWHYLIKYCSIGYYNNICKQLLNKNLEITL
ncbi:hypothetical protein EZS27_019062 [termite gut metagenome]|uniref:Uncharacterized protein n=1 Tax=termite gut metagenome TaxID=433724 RepID=A0A5J4RHX7_9ZZZZ